MRAHKILFATLLGLLFASSLVYAEQAKQVLRVGFSADYSDGLDLRIYKAIAQKLNTQLDARAQPFTRRLFYMKTGQIDLLIGLLKSAEREQYIHYIEPPYKTKSRKVFFVLKGQTSLISSYEDLYDWFRLDNLWL